RALDRIQRLQGECTRLVQVSNDFLRFAGVKNLQLQPSQFGAIIEEMADFFLPTARQHSIEIKVYVPADLPLIPLDRDLFKQALLTLMLNAQQAMPEGGELTIQAQPECGTRNAERGAEESSSALRVPSSALVLSLIDTGKGMTPEVQAKVFKPFFSTKPGGSG